MPSDALFHTYASDLMSHLGSHNPSYQWFTAVFTDFTAILCQCITRIHNCYGFLVSLMLGHPDVKRLLQGLMHLSWITGESTWLRCTAEAVSVLARVQGVPVLQGSHPVAQLKHSVQCCWDCVGQPAMRRGISCSLVWSSQTALHLSSWWKQLMKAVDWNGADITTGFAPSLLHWVSFSEWRFKSPGTLC